MMRGEKKTTLRGETVFVLQGLFPSERHRNLSGTSYTPGRWATLYAWCFACGEERSGAISDESRKRLAKLKVKAQHYTGIPGALNLHHEGLAYLERADAHAAVKLIRKWKSCKYKVRVVRETVWKEIVIDDYPKEPLLRPFYWEPGSAGDQRMRKHTAESAPIVDRPATRAVGTYRLPALKREALHIAKGGGRVLAIRFLCHHRPAWGVKEAMDLLNKWQRARPK